MAYAAKQDSNAVFYLIKYAGRVFLYNLCFITVALVDYIYPKKDQNNTKQRIQSQCVIGGYNPSNSRSPS